MTQYYSRTDTVLNGDVYSIPFSYSKEEEINVYLNDELYTNWEFLNDSQIQLIEIPSNLPSDTVVSIRRITDISTKVVEYTNNSLLNKENLNKSQDQLLQAVQEIYDNNEQFKSSTTETLQTSVQIIEEKVDSAVETADRAEARIIEAVTIAQEANELSNNAVLTANEAFANSQYAVETADTANTTAYEAFLISNEAKALSQAAEMNASEAKEKVDIFEENIQEVIEAAEDIAKLENAVATAVTASENATQAADNAAQAADNAVAALESKLDKTGTAEKALADAAGDNIIDTYRKVVDSYSKNEVNLLLQDKANPDLSNLTEEGEKHFLNKQQITNCLLEVPQRIKYDLTDGTLTIKAGSVVIVPYGVEDLTTTYPVGSTFLNDNFKVADTQYADGKFFVWVEFVNDCVSEQYTSTGVYTRVVSIALNTFKICWNASHYSVTATPSYDHGAQFYNTTTNECWNTTSDGTIANQLSLPFCIITSDTSYAFASVDQVFNGMGYIGSTVWLDKGVKGLIPSGFNSDGSLKNIERTVGNFTTATLTAHTTSNMPFGMNASGTVGWSDALYIQEKNPNDNYSHWYKPSENILYYAGATVGDYKPNNTLICGFLGRTNGVVTEWEPKQSFHAPDIQDVVRKTGDTMTGTLELYGTSSHFGLFGGNIFTHDMNISMDTAPSSNTYFPVIEHQDKNNTRKSRVESLYKTDGGHGIQLSEKHGSSYSAITAGFDANGKAYTYAPHCDITNGIVTQAGLSKSGNGYCKFGNGIILAWGYASPSSNYATITFPTTFTGAQPRVTVTQYNSSGSVGNQNNAIVTSVTSTNFKVYTEQPIFWNAICY